MQTRSPLWSWVGVLSISLVAGAVVGWLCARVIFVGSALALIPWAVVGLVVGWLVPGWRFAIAAGAVYGFALGLTFTIAGYEGSGPVSTALLLFLVIGLIGAVCGIGCAAAGYGTRRLIGRRQAR